MSVEPASDGGNSAPPSQGPSQGCGVGGVEIGEERIAGQLGVPAAHLLYLHLASGGLGGGLEAGPDPISQHLEPLEVLGSYVPLRPGEGGDDVGRLPAVGDDPVDLVGREDVLAEGGDVHIGLDEGIESVYALLGKRRRMGLLAVKGHLHLDNRQGWAVDHVSG